MAREARVSFFYFFRGRERAFNQKFKNNILCTFQVDALSVKGVVSASGVWFLAVPTPEVNNLAFFRARASRRSFAITARSIGVCLNVRGSSYLVVIHIIGMCVTFPKI